MFWLQGKSDLWFLLECKYGFSSAFSHDKIWWKAIIINATSWKVSHSTFIDHIIIMVPKSSFTLH